MSPLPELPAEGVADRIPEDDSSDSDDYSTASEDSLPPLEQYGHRYHGSGRVYFPCDEHENARLSFQHRLFKLLIQGELYTAKLPIDPETPPPANSHDRYQILDAGTGNGLWSMEMGQKFPAASIRAIDLTSALLPQVMPPNVTFEIADLACSDGWPEYRTYDYIFIRNLIGGGIRDWKRFLELAFRQLKPGGIIEFVDFRPLFFDVDPNIADLPEGTVPDIGPVTRQFYEILTEVCIKLHIDLDPVAKVPDWYTEIGATNIQLQRDFVPLSEWGQDINVRRKGEAARKVMDNAMELCTLRMLCEAGLKEDTARKMLDAVTRESRDPMLRTLMEW